MRECAPDDRLREAIRSRGQTSVDCFVAPLLAMTLRRWCAPNWPQPTAAAPGSQLSVRSAVSVRECRNRNAPVLSFAPISAAERAPAAMLLQIVVRPTPKQGRRSGSALARPSADLPDTALDVAERIGSKQSLDHIPVAGAARGPDGRGRCPWSPANDAARCRRPPGPCIRQNHARRATSARIASRRDRHCRRTDSRSRH